MCEITSTVPVPSCLNAQELGAWKRAYTKRTFRAQAWDQSGLFYLDKALEWQCSGQAVTQLLLFAAGISDFQPHSAHFDIT